MTSLNLTETPPPDPLPDFREGELKGDSVRRFLPEIDRKVTGWGLAWLWAIPVILLAAWLGARGLNADALWYDEWLSVYYAGGAQYGPVAPADIWQRVAERSTWPPGFQTLLAGWGAAVGWHHAAARVLPWLVGVLAVAWMYRLGRDLVSHRVGISAAVMLGASAFFANYLHELRGYTFSVLFSVMCVWSYWRIMRGRGGVWTQLTFFVSVVGLLYIHYFAALTAVAVALYHLLFVAKTRAWWRVPILMALAGICFLPWAGIAFATAQDTLLSETRRIIPLSAGAIIETFATSFSNGSVALLILLCLYSLRGVNSMSRRCVVMLAWLWVGCTLGIALLANEPLRVIFHVRHLMAVWAALALACALGVDALARRGVPSPLILALWIGAGVWNAYDPAFINEQPGTEVALGWEDLSAVLERVETSATPDDALLFHVEEPGREWLTEPIVDYYAEPLGIRHNQLEEIPGLPPDDDYFRQARDFLDDAPRVWLVVKPDVPSPFQLAEFQRVLAADYAACGRAYAGSELTLDLYARAPNAAEAPFRFGDSIGLHLLESLPERVDKTLDVLTGWTVAESVPANTYSYGLHLTDAQGNLVAQADAGLSSEPFSCALVTLDVSALPPGDYAVYALVYHWQTSERLISEAADGTRGDRAEIGRVRIE